MLYYLITTYFSELPGANLINYITFRAGGATLTALIVSFLLGPWLIGQLKRMQGKGQPIREDGPQSHIIAKAGTPTMGGLMILLSVLLATLLWGNPSNMFTWIIVLTTLSFGLIGFIDDYMKIKFGNSRGVSGRAKLAIQFALAAISSYLLTLQMPSALATGFAFPFFKDALVMLGLPLFLVVASFVIVGASNAVNLTDGLDGLAIVPALIAAASFGFISYLVGNVIFSNYLQIHYVPGVGELAVFTAALIGAGLGFLWFNAPPAMVFMGDTGSLALGAALGTIAVATKHEVVLAIIGGLFVLEAVSVIVQVASFKLTGKRVFRMAPLHHHFELRGWAEPTVVIRFWIISVILALVGLATLKLR